MSVAGRAWRVAHLLSFELEAPLATCAFLLASAGTQSVQSFS